MIPHDPNIQISSYVLEARLAVGGTAEVFLARHASGERVVIKRLLPELLGDEALRAMFRREAALQAAVRHDNIVAVLGSGVGAQSEPFLVLEYVEGLDAHRLLRRLRLHGRPLPNALAVHVVREVLAALGAVHSARDAAGENLGIVHRDVTPSNVYLARSGQVKLGDFGIACARAPSGSERGTELRGKASYLAPEQVNDEPFDLRADLFSVASVLAEMLIGEPLFGGGSKLAVLLAIRDGHIDPLVSYRGELPPALYDVLLRALARDPDRRFASAAAFSAALEPFAPPRDAATRELSALVTTAADESETDQTRAAEAIEASDDDVATGRIDAETASDRVTGEYAQVPSFVTSPDGVRRGPWGFAQLAMALATGAVGGNDAIAYAGAPPARAAAIKDLARFLPLTTPTTRSVQTPEGPDASYALTPGAMLSILLDVLGRSETAMLFCSSEPNAPEPRRKELYFVRGRLVHVASSNASELLGEYLVGRRRISREELSLALAVLPHYQGRLGDTLVALGLVTAVEVFQAIRDQGRDRVADLFSWTSGSAQLYRGQLAQHVEFPLDLDIGTLLIAGMESLLSGEAAIDRYRPRLAASVGPATPGRPTLASVKWPATIASTLALTRTPTRLSDLLASATRGGASTTGAVLRALEILIEAQLVAFL